MFFFYYDPRVLTPFLGTCDREELEEFYGPVMAMLSPLLLEYARRHWPGWAWAGSFALVMVAVMIAGMRSGWLAMGMVIAVYAVLMLRRENRELRRLSLTIPVIAVIVIGWWLWKRQQRRAV